MRKFFCLSAGLAACTVAGLATAGGPQIQAAGNGTELTPTRYAGISQDGKLTTPWFYTADRMTDGPCGEDTFFDSFDYNSPDGGPENGEICDNTFQPSTRWFFGASWCNTWAVNDISALADGAGSEAGHGKFGWQWYVDGTNSEQCYLVTFTYEDFDDTCNGPAASNGYDGVILDFGVLAPGAGYYWANVNNLCDNGLFYTMPADGEGAYDMQLWNFYDGANFDFATCGQPMLWGQREGQPADGASGEYQWDDDSDLDANGNCTADPNGFCENLPDGVLQAPFECYTYAFGLCPDPLGAMAAFIGEGGPTECLGLEIDKLVGGGTSTWTITDSLGSNAVVALVYGTAPGSTSVNGFAGYCATFGIKGVNQNKLVCQGRLTSGVKTCKSFIPTNFVGRQVLTQAAMRDTCDDECMSNLLDLVVQ